MRFSGKHVVVTGATSGLGQAIAVDGGFNVGHSEDI